MSGTTVTVTPTLIVAPVAPVAPAPTLTVVKPAVVVVTPAAPVVVVPSASSTVVPVSPLVAPVTPSPSPSLLPTLAVLNNQSTMETITWVIIILSVLVLIFSLFFFIGNLRELSADEEKAKAQESGLATPLTEVPKGKNAEQQPRYNLRSVAKGKNQQAQKELVAKVNAYYNS
jgi:hypothetical protein